MSIKGSIERNRDTVGIKDNPRTRGSLPERNGPRSSRRNVVLISIFSLVLLVFALSSTGFRLYSNVYHDDLPLAKTGMHHLQKAESLLVTMVHNPLATQRVADAQQEFIAALKDFTQVDNDLRPALSVAALIPHYGNRFRAALHLLPLAIALSQAGITGCDILNLLIARTHAMMNGQQNAFTTADFNFLSSSVHEIQASLSTSLNEADQIQPTDLQFDPRISVLVNKVRQDIPMAQRWLGSIEKVLPIIPTLLGMNTPTKYLVEILDSTELRPGGGFIGNYGIATFADGWMKTLRVTDTELLDHRFTQVGLRIPFPPAYQWFDLAWGNWGVRDSNLDADFPTAAQDAETLYGQEGGNTTFQGVFAITPVFVQRVLEITGPIAVPEYHEVISAQNLVERIHYYQITQGGINSDTIASPDGHSSLQKRFTALLAEHFVARMQKIAPTKIPQLLQIFVGAMLSKDVQVYFNNPAAEALLHNAHLDASIQSTPGDGIMVVDANISVNKASSLVTNTLTDRVTINADGSAIHHATLDYAWNIPGESYGAPLYRDYIRVYVPEGSTLLAQDGWEPRGISTAFGREVWAGFLLLGKGQSKTVTLTWKVPHAATFNGNTWHYQNLIQRQAGTMPTVHMRVLLPACAHLIRTSGALQAANKRIAVLDRLLTENTSGTLDYGC